MAQVIFLLFPIAKKKNKKGKTLTLTNFLAEGGGGGGPTAYTPKPVSWADETDDLEGDGKTAISCLVFSLSLVPLMLLLLLNSFYI